MSVALRSSAICFGKFVELRQFDSVKARYQRQIELFDIFSLFSAPRPLNASTRKNGIVGSAFYAEKRRDIMRRTVAMVYRFVFTFFVKISIEVAVLPLRLSCFPRASVTARNILSVPPLRVSEKTDEHVRGSLSLRELCPVTEVFQAFRKFLSAGLLSAILRRLSSALFRRRTQSPYFLRDSLLHVLSQRVRFCFFSRFQFFYYIRPPEYRSAFRGSERSEFFQRVCPCGGKSFALRKFFFQNTRKFRRFKRFDRFFERRDIRAFATETEF